jgi:hypothetical protein
LSVLACAVASIGYSTIDLKENSIYGNKPMKREKIVLLPGSSLFS